MPEYLLFTIRKQQSWRNLAYILLFILIFSPICSAQDEGISIHGDFFSGTFVYGFTQNYDHPGNFLLGGQYNYPVSPLFELTGGLDFLWVELYGRVNNVNKEAEVFIPFITGGAALNFDQWRIFGKVGYSLAGSVNNIGSGKGWVSSILDFNMGSFQFGIKYPIYNELSLSTSACYYFGQRIPIESNHVIFSSVNLGLSYNLFNTEPVSPVVSEGVNEYKEKYLAAQSENSVLFKQIVELHDKIKALSPNADKVETFVKPAVIPEIPVETISVDSLNAVYNLHIGEPLNLKDFVNKKTLKEAGKLILGEYNSIASSFNKLPAGIYFICTAQDINAFTKSETDFPRIKFRADPASKNKLIISIDIKETELNNKIKLEIK
ncbi:MAG: hypothetical protein P4L27_14285 [Ignavibacteriaceae bacterium]|nr:hypothetical protein [Ignavibacteriaceae bacterium]